MSIFGIDGTDTWQRGPKVAKRNGRFTEAPVEDDLAIEGFRPAVVYFCDHRGLRTRDRCLCCGRTRNEIALDGDE